LQKRATPLRTSLLVLALTHTLAVLGYWPAYFECRDDWALAQACAIVRPSPLYTPGDFDTCEQYEVRCHYGPRLRL
jgi:hypothetical protein